MKLKSFVAAGALLALAVVASIPAFAAGNWPGYPVVGGTGGEAVLSGAETVPNDTNLPGGQNPQTQVVTITQLLQGVTTTNSSATSATATAAQTYSGAFTQLRLTGAPSSGQNLTLPTAAATLAVIPNVVIGSTWLLRIVNVGGTSSGVWTVLVGSGYTLTGNVTVAVAGSRVFACTVTAVTSPAITCIDNGN